MSQEELLDDSLEGSLDDGADVGTKGGIDVGTEVVTEVVAWIGDFDCFDLGITDGIASSASQKAVDFCFSELLNA